MTLYLCAIFKNKITMKNTKLLVGTCRCRHVVGLCGIKERSCFDDGCRKAGHFVGI